jgi:hypothetical protein
MPVVFQIIVPPAGRIFSCHKLPSERKKTTMAISSAPLFGCSI